MNWEGIEDKMCCLIFLKNHVINNVHISNSVREAIEHGVDKSEGSIKMKFSNIKSICGELGIDVKTQMTRLDSYSKQVYEEFLAIKDYTLIQVFKELNKIKNGTVD